MAVKSFSDYIEKTEKSKEITIVSGSFNPPLACHEKIFETAFQVARGSKYRIRATHLQNESSNPLDYDKKIKYMRKMFPRHARSIITDSYSSIHQMLSDLYMEGYDKVNVIVPGETESYERIFEKYNGRKTRHGFYHFSEGIHVISAKMDQETSLISESAQMNEYQEFCKHVPSNFKESKELFNDIRKGMGLKETYDFRSHVQLEAVSDIREAYVEGELFEVGDTVVIKESDEVGQVAVLGSNYLIIEMENGRKVRKWLDGVEKLRIAEDDEDIHEDWFNDLLGKASTLTNRGGYREARKILQQVIDRKKKEGPLRHPVTYYAAQIAKQYRGNIDPRQLARMVEEERVLSFTSYRNITND